MVPPQYSPDFFSQSIGNVYPSHYFIYLETAYKDHHCEPPSSVSRTELNNPVFCSLPGSYLNLNYDYNDLPRLWDQIRTVANGLPTEVSYIWKSNASGPFQTWIEFVFPSLVPLERVDLFYHCTGNPLQLRFLDELNRTISNMTTICGDSTHLERLSFSLDRELQNARLSVKPGEGSSLYLTEVEFIMTPVSRECIIYGQVCLQVDNYL